MDEPTVGSADSFLFFSLLVAWSI